MISPSKDVREISERHTKDFPRSVRLLLRSLGALSHESRPLLSYLLFESAFCQELIELGYQDGLNARSEISELLELDKPGS